MKYTNNPMIREDLEIRRVSDYPNVLRALHELSDSHSPSLFQSIPNIDDYAKKIAENAEVYMVVPSFAAMIAFYNNDRVGGSAYITEIAVKKQYQHMGFARKLLEVCFCRARQEGMKQVKLEVYRDNLVAIRFYERNGFCVLGDASNKKQFMIKTL